MHAMTATGHRRAARIPALLLVFVAAGPARAADNPYLRQPRTRSVAVFEIGCGFLT
jgi:hypothetical protein